MDSLTRRIRIATLQYCPYLITHQIGAYRSTQNAFNDVTSRANMLSFGPCRHRSGQDLRSGYDGLSQLSNTARMPRLVLADHNASYSLNLTAPQALAQPGMGQHGKFLMGSDPELIASPCLP
ncbi:hypothetical protein CH63R_05710 [Colletotrichum higginsianum IMI 349063]|uniref:Uncharacterized protein n=1 Tax=Colletotrichum higginsianum (strain IMI 349063) TaxID=759273 RepID=A0A1B7YDY8_COLHI|nr:hypothetical protein CH63R_05710 [Colletotrichum higginsianum IMI 349063]OBR10018.1 hypothetical protein CH63R_05710 [Colletotrichum higginsianum IMI 349063]